MPYLYFHFPPENSITEVQDKQEGLALNNLNPFLVCVDDNG